MGGKHVFSLDSSACLNPLLFTIAPINSVVYRAHRGKMLKSNYFVDRAQMATGNFDLGFVSRSYHRSLPHFLYRVFNLIVRAI